MLNKKTVRDVDVNNKKVLVRCDFNVPLDVNDKSLITNDKRIIESMKTINYLVENGAKVILCSHIGKHKEMLSLAPVAKRLSELLGKEVPLLVDVIGENVKAEIDKMVTGDVVLLDNVRKFKEEEENDENFSEELASLAEIYVNDAFGTAHRAHASTVGVTKHLPAYAGFLIEKELDALDKGINSPKRPLVAIIGGAKVSSKISVLTELLNKVDTLLIGGGMAFTFIKAQGGKIGTSLCEEDRLEEALGILNKAKGKNVKVLITQDVYAADDYSNDANKILAKSDDIPDGYMGLDIGPKTLEAFGEEVSKAGTVVWNGPVGVAEFSNFANGTNSIAKLLADSSAISIIGGGDSAAAVIKAGYEDKMNHISTGGGASLEFMEGKILPGIAALLDK
ncbi:MAG: phosphoglycerate kinase [Clostridia bacterium]|nr:phosphoglycerate kinase [Clostridia bacterium]